MRTVAILPVKSFGGAKQRLQQQLPPRSRRALAEAMFSDVLVALRRACSVDEVLVVSGDLRAQLIAGSHGAGTLRDEERGHNDAAAIGIQAALGQAAGRALLVPGDCPMLDPEEIESLTARPAAPRSVVVVPDRHGSGTNALLLTPPDVMAPAFGPGSCERHFSLASSNGAEAEVVTVSSLALDIDTPDDLRALQQALLSTRGAAAHTRGMLSQLTRTETPEQ